MEFDIGSFLRIKCSKSWNRKIAAQKETENRVVEAHVILRMGNKPISREQAIWLATSSNRTSSLARTVYGSDFGAFPSVIG